MQKELNKKQSEFLAYIGVTGAAIAFTCFAQWLIAMYDFWFNYVFIAIHLYSFIAYIMLVSKKRYSVLLVTISAALTLFVSAAYFALNTLSPIIIVFMLYGIVITVLLYINEYPKKLYHHYLYHKQESDYWEGKI
ncbi:MAG: hypothetical protein ACOVMM_10135 [Chitinophagaceae bacterium]